MKQGFMVDPGKMAVCCATGAGLCFLALAMFWIQKILPAVILVMLGLVYLAAAAFNGARITWDSSGVSQYVLWKKIRKFSWNEIAEVGIVGTKAFHAGAPQKTGRMYLYFSRETMDDNARFQMILRWPPRKQIYLLYQADRVESLRSKWSGPIETYNAGDLTV